MKKAFVFLLGLSALFAACRQPLPAQTGTEIPVTLVAESPATRTYIQETEEAWVPYWRTGDSLTVILSYDMGVQKSFVNQDPDGRTGHFTGSLPIEAGLHSLIAYYPKGMKNGRSEQVFKFKLSEVQHLPSLTTFDPSVDLLVSEQAMLTLGEDFVEADKLRFHRILAVARIILEDHTTGNVLSGKKVKGLKLSSSEALLSGRVSVDVLKRTITAWENKSSFQYVSAVYDGDDWTVDGSNAAYLVVNPTTLSSGGTLTLDVETDDETLAIQRCVVLKQDIAFPAGKVTTLRFTIEDADLGTPEDPSGEGELDCPDPPQEGMVELDKLYGYGQAAGVTGGAGASTVLHFNNGKALQTWLLARTKSEKGGDHSPVTIWLSGTFGPGDGRDFSEGHPWFDVKEVSNLSFLGTDDFVMDRIGFFCVRSSNLVFRNINFRQPKADNGADAVSMQQCEGVWVDHCTFTSLNQTKDYEDGSCDITHHSKGVTVSWCHFVKTQKSCLVGHSNSESADVAITATFHHNWFDQSSSRHPRVRYGQAHVYNNFFDGCTTYGVGSAYGAKVLVEYNCFDAVQLPTDICTYPAKESGESNLQGSVAGYLYATRDLLLNRPAKARDPYPLTNVKYTSYNGGTVTPLTYADFKPAYGYVVTPSADVADVVKAGAGYGKLGWTTAPVEVNNGGIEEYNGSDGSGDTPDDPDQPGGETPDGPHTYAVWMSDSKAVTVSVDGQVGGSFFTTSTAAADFRTASETTYNGPFTIGDVTYQYGFKMDSNGSIAFKTSDLYTSTLRFYFVRRKKADTGACMRLIPEGGTETVFDTTPFEAYADSGELPLQPGTNYTVKQKTKEQAVILLIVTEKE
jgi:pectate lyase